MKNIKITA